MEPIKRVPIVQQVEEQIRQLIESGQYNPGDKLPAEMDLCQRLGVGRGTIREAFRLLQARGYVEIKPGRGAFVSERLPGEDMGAVEWLLQNELELRDAIDIRRALEPMAARRMAEQGGEEDVQRLEQLHSCFMQAIQAGDAAQIAKLDEAFHSAIIEGSKNHLLIAINQQVNQGMKTFRSKTFQVPQNIRNAVVPHTRIMQAIQTRDGAGAESEMRAHLDKVREDLQENITNPSSEL